jgi:histone deacetylase 11
MLTESIQTGMKIIYSAHYNITFFGIEKLHPFDSRKYGRAWAVLKKEFGRTLQKYQVSVERAVSERELLLAHTPAYLSSLRSSRSLAIALELPPLAMLPAGVIRWRVLRPMRWAVQGSIEAARCALDSGLAVNLSGGYHHAKPDQGEGFCLFSDAAMIVRQLRAEKRIQNADKILYVDLDAHQGNGVCHQFRGDPSVRIFDMYNRDIYPRGDIAARDRINCDVPLEFNCTGSRYLRLLREKLPDFLDEEGEACLGIYNAGTDPYAHDKLGGLCLSAADILDRDLFVIDQLRARKVPVVMLLSGGYSRESFRLVAATVGKLVQRCELSKKL